LLASLPQLDPSRVLASSLGSTSWIDQSSMRLQARSTGGATYRRPESSVSSDRPCCSREARPRCSPPRRGPTYCVSRCSGRPIPPCWPGGQQCTGRRKLDRLDDIAGARQPTSRPAACALASSAINRRSVRPCRASYISSHVGMFPSIVHRITGGTNGGYNCMSVPTDRMAN
jgi:hypothetical protein